MKSSIRITYCAVCVKKKIFFLWKWKWVLYYTKANFKQKRNYTCGILGPYMVGIVLWGVCELVSCCSISNCSIKWFGRASWFLNSSIYIISSSKRHTFRTVKYCRIDMSSNSITTLITIKLIFLLYLQYAMIIFFLFI